MTETTTERNTNRLIDATSPYLLQHAHNPVDWHEWGEESLSKAKKEDKPIFLSIGYAACHWCHVMEHESFESEDVAAVLNESFVSIKVDREERPDIDEIYMAYTQQATGGGGWPMSVWLTPDGRPFYAGTYFPRAQFVNLLKTISDAWLNRRDEVLAGAQNAKKFFDQWAQGPAPAEGVIPKQVVIQTADLLAQHFDKAYGGLAGGGTNKFPPSMAMELMLRANEHEPKNEYIDAVVLTLDQMARGGIYDHIGGGICRYSTDVEWLVPHFEKMLYDQAMVSSIYLDGYQATGRGQFADVARDIFAYVLEDLTDPQGGFYSSRDADSDGLEGAFYIWTVEEVHELLGTEDGPLFCSLFDVTERGNWFERLGHAPPGPKNILRLRKPIEGFAKANGINPAELQTRVDNWRSTLKQARNKRTPPGLDDKILTGWNGLMIASLARASRVLDEPEFAAAAAKAADFILDSLQKDGRLLRTFRNGKARLTGYLSDYAFFVEALINLYQATFERKWLAEAQRLADVAVAQYHDDKNGGFYFTADDGEELIVRAKSAYDGAIPSGNSVMAMNLLRLAILLDRKDYRDLAESTFRVLSPRVERNPLAFEKLLCAVDFYHDRVKEIAVIGDPSAADTRALLETVDARYMPNKVLALAHPPASASISDSDGADLKIPLLSGKKKKDGSATAYVCERYRCRLPVTTPEALRMELDRK